VIARAGLRSGLIYGLVAGLCLGLHNAIIIGLDALGAPLLMGVVVSFGVVAATGYALHSRFTFRRAMGMAAFGRYVLAMSANIPLAFATTWFWHRPMGLAMPFAAPVASACMMLANFLLSRWAIVAPGRHRERS
jgi:putative flippase GtrA